MKHTFFFLFIFLSFFNNIVIAQYIPPHREGVSQADYDKWKKRIIYFHQKLNEEPPLVDKGKVVCLLNTSTAYHILGEPVDSVYGKLEEMLAINKYEACLLLDYVSKGSFDNNVKNNVGVKRWHKIKTTCQPELEEYDKKKAEKKKKEYETYKDVYNDAQLEKDRLILVSYKEHLQYKHHIDEIGIYYKKTTKPLLEVTDSKTTIYILPKGFKGLVMIAYGEKNGQAKTKNKLGVRLIKIPQTGHLKTQFKELPFDFALGKYEWIYENTPNTPLQIFQRTELPNLKKEEFGVLPLGYNQGTRPLLNKFWEKKFGEI